MRVLMLNYEFPPLGGGAGNATFYLLKEFAKQPNVTVDLITSSTGKFDKYQLSPNITIHRLDISKDGKLHFQSYQDLIRYSFKAYQYAQSLKKESNFDVTHAFFGIPGGFIASKLNIPYIVSLRGSDVPFYNQRFKILDTLLFKRMSQKIWGEAKHVVANSKGLKQLALKSKPDQDIKTIENGVDIEQFKPAPESKVSEFTIISTSRLIQRKGIKFLITAFAQLQKEYGNCRLVLIGDGDQKDNLISQAKELGVESSISFLGQVNHDDLPKYYQSSQVFVLPSLNEGMSNSVLEALACGLPVISTDTGGTAELINERNGFTVPQQNSSEIHTALKKIYTNSQLQKEKSIAARSTAEGLSWAAAAGKYRDLYE